MQRARWQTRSLPRGRSDGGKPEPRIVGLIGKDKDASSYYLQEFPQWDLVDVQHTQTLSASELRRYLYEAGQVDMHGGRMLIRANVPGPVFEMLEAFRRNSPVFGQLVAEYQFIETYRAAWADAPYPPTFVTTDAVIVHSGHVLLVRRRAEPGKGLWALPGGFVDQAETIEQACLRELRKEETRVKIPMPVLRGSIKGTHVFDHPERSLRGRTITHAFHFDFPAGDLPDVRGGDDADKARWVPVSEALDMGPQLFEDHLHILEFFLEPGLIRSLIQLADRPPALTRREGASVMQCLNNLLLNTDSYKASHWLQYPPNTDATFFYVESRGGLYDRTVFYGLQAILKEYLSKPITHADVDEARDVFAAHGEPFNEAGWRHIVDTHGGLLPLRIRAVPEGSVVPTHQALVTIESTDPRAYWVPSYIETLLLRLWYPVTVATISWHAKQTIRQFLDRTSDDPAGQLPFKLHDFGARGVSSAESAALGGSAHLVNFMGTDTVSGLLAAKAYYNEPMAGFSIPAAEHSTITSWGREHEVDAYRNMLRQFAKPGAIVAVVSDSYDIFHAIREHWGRTLKEEVIRSGATLVVRPDSGDPVAVVHQCLELLDEAFGHFVNGKGYKVLNHVRVIQGDGINPDSIRAILERVTSAGYATDNIAFGMGGALATAAAQPRYPEVRAQVLGGEGRWSLDRCLEGSNHRQGKAEQARAHDPAAASRVRQLPHRAGAGRSRIAGRGRQADRL